MRGNMSDHYHYASDIQGAADDNHSHAPRDIGAAEEHDLDMLERRVNSLEADVRSLERDKAASDQRIFELQGRVIEMADGVRDFIGLVKIAVEEGRL
jgi:hypothetical protein